MFATTSNIYLVFSGLYFQTAAAYRANNNRNQSYTTFQVCAYLV